jgi:hypothetical protein
MRAHHQNHRMVMLSRFGDARGDLIQRLALEWRQRVIEMKEGIERQVVCALGQRADLEAAAVENRIGQGHSSRKR